MRIAPGHIMRRRGFNVEICCSAIIILMLTCTASAEILVFNSITPSENQMTRDSWLQAVDIVEPEFLVDFEIGFVDGQNISGVEGLFPMGLILYDTSLAQRVTITSGSIGGSYPVGQFSATQNEQKYLELDFTSAPVDYLAFQDIDQAGTIGIVVFEDLTTAQFSFETTGTGVSSAEFVGLYRNDMPRMSRILLDASGDGLWGIDTIEFGVKSISSCQDDGIFSSAVNYVTGTIPRSIHPSDFDGDGNCDLVTVGCDLDNYDVYLVSILLNNGDGTFAEAMNYNTSGRTSNSVYASDLDGDGDNDLAVANTFSYDISILMNHGDGTFAEAVCYPAGIFPLSVCASDFDGDGDSDLAVGNGTSEVSILANNGDGTFSARVSYSVGNEPYSACASDLDGDGDNDLAVANRSSDNISILRNNGDGTFSNAVNYDVGDAPASVCAFDLEGDGDGDLAVANHDSHNISILMNNGECTFTEAGNYATGYGPYSICASDFDGDGDFDLSATADESDILSILENNGDGSFAPTECYLAGNGPITHCVSDIDGDGYCDLAVTNVAGYISILVNQSPVSSGVGDLSPLMISLGQNQPNPFNPSTTIVFSQPRAGQVSLAIYALDGSLVRALVKEQLPAGTYEVVWTGVDESGRRVASGTYFYRLEAGEFTQTKKMVLLK